MFNCFPKHPLTQAWLNDTTKHVYLMEGYSAFHLGRTKREHGGISILVRNDIHTHILHEYCLITGNLELYTKNISK